MRRSGQRDVQNSITREKGCQTYVRIGVLFPNMLRFLRISRLAVIDTVEVEFEPGFNVLTGETGAGKSILVEAVGLLLGGRASSDLVRTGDEVAGVEALFQRGSDEVVIRREVTAQGRSRAFVNGSLVTAGALRDLAASLIELHGQREHQTLLDPAIHLLTLDAFASLDRDIAEVGQAYRNWREKVRAFDDFLSNAQDKAARLELAAFHLAEIQKASPSAVGEDAELTSTRAVLANAARIQQLCSEGYAALYDSDNAILTALAGVWKRVAELAALDRAFEAHLVARDAIKAQLEDLADALRRYSEDLDTSPSRLQQVEDRLAVLERIKRKHGPTLGDVLAKRDQLADLVASLHGGEERRAAAEAEADAARQRYLDLALKLSEKRREAAARFGAELIDLLAGLALERTRFDIRFEDRPDESAWTDQGVDRAEFFISPNPGEDLRPLAKIVSGGELSRIMLALKTMTFKARLRGEEEAARLTRMPGTGAPGMIFDEVDAGIGGRVAGVVGQRLRRLGSAFQVLCITHLPQVAAQADAHFVVDKRIRSGRTEAKVRRLDEEGRVEELARMLAGSARSEAVLTSARELLTRAAAVGGAKGEAIAKDESESSKARHRRGAVGA
jgi:DNA repair protein RecN (Recombination protein N)